MVAKSKICQLIILEFDLLNFFLLKGLCLILKLDVGIKTSFSMFSLPAQSLVLEGK